MVGLQGRLNSLICPALTVGILSKLNFCHYELGLDLFPIKTILWQVDNRSPDLGSNWLNLG